jgi:hypothetical protein
LKPGFALAVTEIGPGLQQRVEQPVNRIAVFGIKQAGCFAVFALCGGFDRQRHPRNLLHRRVAFELTRKRDTFPESAIGEQRHHKALFHVDVFRVEFQRLAVKLDRAAGIIVHIRGPAGEKGAGKTEKVGLLFLGRGKDMARHCIAPLFRQQIGTRQMPRWLQAVL